jgi:hypothetical protein
MNGRVPGHRAPVKRQIVKCEDATPFFNPIFHSDWPKFMPRLPLQIVNRKSTGFTHSLIYSFTTAALLRIGDRRAKGYHAADFVEPPSPYSLSYSFT